MYLSNTSFILYISQMTKEKKVLKFKGEIKEISLDKLIPYEFNNKVHHEEQVNLLANIMGKFGYIDEIVVDRNNIIIAGHGRLESIRKMGYDSVEVKVMDIDAKDASQLRILHNKIGEYATEYHLENLNLELQTMGYEDDISWLDISMRDLFPEFDAPNFDADDYDVDNNEWGGKKIAVIIMAEDLAEAEIIKQDVEWLWREAKVRG